LDIQASTFFTAISKGNLCVFPILKVS
jgi:hypothetical protein